MDHLESLRLFVKVAETGSFSQAARRAGCSASAATRAIGSLEARLEAQLLHRTTRRVSLTEGGERFLQDCRRILLDLERAEASVSRAAEELSGPLSVTASVMFGRLFIAPIAVSFLELFPKVQLRLMLVDHLVDMMAEGIDVAVRIAELPDSSLSATRVGSVRRVVCASPDYLAQHGEPRSPADLANHEAIQYAGGGPQRWSFHWKNRTRVVSPKMRMTVNSTEVATQFAVAGLGLTRALVYQLVPELRAGKLKIILTKYEPPAVPIHVLHRERPRTSHKVRAFVDLVVQRLRAEAYLTEPPR
ncbi:MAG TPA: LysR family transcriptional regulator [Polyangiaceae bacterium]|nr:LysR family transcriptional regulator [Polyangiaceae bacterium]